MVKKGSHLSFPNPKMTQVSKSNVSGEMVKILKDDESLSKLNQVDGDRAPVKVLPDGRHDDVDKSGDALSPKKSGKRNRPRVRFQCPNCQLKFPLRILYIRHFQTAHWRRKIACDICKKEFRRKADLRIHKETVHLNGGGGEGIKTNDIASDNNAVPKNQVKVIPPGQQKRLVIVLRKLRQRNSAVETKRGSFGKGEVLNSSGGSVGQPLQGREGVLEESDSYLAEQQLHQSSSEKAEESQKHDKRDDDDGDPSVLEDKLNAQEAMEDEEEEICMEELLTAPSLVVGTYSTPIQKPTRAPATTPQQHPFQVGVGSQSNSGSGVDNGPCDICSVRVCDFSSHLYNTHLDIPDPEDSHRTEKQMMEIIVQDSDPAPGLPTRSDSLLCRCSLCGKEFNREISYKVHLHTEHLGVPFKCHVCGRVFQQRVDIAQHFRVTTCGLPPDHTVCGRCGMQFKTAYKRYKHWIKVHQVQ